MPNQDEEYEVLVAQLSEVASQLDELERCWRDKQGFLESRGFMLRARYHPEWTPSWFTNGRELQRCEDFYRLPPRPNLTDALRMSDNKLVYVKRVETDKSEGRIARLFSEPYVANDPKNHCVPILDFFEDNEDPRISYMVMPFLRFVNNPPFTSVNDIVELVDQLLEGLVFMHEHGVAHRDCAFKNILMDASPLYKKQFHPVLQNLSPDMSTPVQPTYSRFTSPSRVKYYFIDFGISSHFPPGQPQELVLGIHGLDKDVPELSDTVPYDAFKVDIFVLGNFFKEVALEKFSNVAFLSALVDSMTIADPSSRPNATAVLEHWKTAQASLGIFQRAMPLEPIGQGNTAGVLRLWPYFNLWSLLLKKGLVSTARILGIIRG